jgi:hypothetical protein
MPSRGRTLILSLAVGLAGTLAAAVPASARDLAGTASAVRPFKLSFTAATVPGQPGELSLESITMSGPGLDREAFYGGCELCTGRGQFGRWHRSRSGSWIAPIVNGTITLTDHTRIVEAVTLPGHVGRFKVYAVKPGGRLLALRQDGCISPTQENLSRILSQGISALDTAPCSGLLLPTRGTAVHLADPITVTFRVPQPLPSGRSWALALSFDSKQPGCASFDARFFPGQGLSGQLLSATFRPTDRLASPSPLPQWCTGSYTVAAFSTSDRGSSVKPVAVKAGVVTVGP